MPIRSSYTYLYRDMIVKSTSLGCLNTGRNFAIASPYLLTLQYVKPDTNAADISKLYMKLHGKFLRCRIVC